MGRFSSQDPSSEAGALGLGELRSILTSAPQTVPEGVYKQGDIYAQDQLDQDLSSLESQFKAANPGADVANNSAYLNKREDLIGRNREMRTGARDAQEFAYQNAQAQRRVQAMQTALNLDQTQMNYLLQLAEMDLAGIMQQTGLDYAEAAQVKELFGGIGETMIEEAVLTPFRGGSR